MSTNTFLDGLHRSLGRSQLASRLAVLVRNQCRRIIACHLSEGPNFSNNGEAWLNKFFAIRSSVFVDVGANVGRWTELFLSEGGGKKGLLFEPSEYAFEVLNKRFQNMQNITVIKACVSDSVGEISFFEEPEGGETSSFDPKFSSSKAIKRVVATTTLDVEAKQHQLTHIDFLKIDTEGYDLHVLHGSAGLLSGQKIGVIQFEYNAPWAAAGSTLRSAFDLLKSFGYQVFLLKSSGLYKLNYDVYGEYFEYSNFVAVSPNSLADLQPYLKGEI